MDIAEIQVQSDQNAALTPALANEESSHPVQAGFRRRRYEREILLAPGWADIFERKFLVDFELQALVCRGRSTTP